MMPDLVGRALCVLLLTCGFAVAQTPVHTPPPAPATNQLTPQMLGDMLQSASTFHDLVQNMNLNESLGPDQHVVGPDGQLHHPMRRTMQSLGAGAGAGAAIGAMTHRAACSSVRSSAAPADSSSIRSSSIARGARKKPTSPTSNTKVATAPRSPSSTNRFRFPRPNINTPTRARDASPWSLSAACRSLDHFHRPRHVALSPNRLADPRPNFAHSKFCAYDA